MVSICDNSSLNDYEKPFVNHVGSLSVLKYITYAIELTNFTINQKANSKPNSANFSYYKVLIETNNIYVLS